MREMKRKVYLIASMIMVLIIGASLIIIFIPQKNTKNPYEAKQEALAKQLGVHINDYPYERAFPEGYFYTILKPGMTVAQVHQIIQGYEQVYRCRSSPETHYYSEIYYYFGTGDKDAMRFETLYDSGGRYKRFFTDDDSSPLLTNGCEIGLIRE